MIKRTALLIETDAELRELERRARVGSKEDLQRYLRAKGRRRRDLDKPTLSPRSRRLAQHHFDNGNYRHAFSVLDKSYDVLDADGHDLLSQSALHHVNSLFDRHANGEDISTDELVEAGRMAAHVHRHHITRADRNHPSWKHQSSASSRQIKNSDGTKLDIYRIDDLRHRKFGPRVSGIRVAGPTGFYEWKHTHRLSPWSSSTNPAIVGRVYDPSVRRTVTRERNYRLDRDRKPYAVRKRSEKSKKRRTLSFYNRPRYS